MGKCCHRRPICALVHHTDRMLSPNALHAETFVMSSSFRQMGNHRSISDLSVHNTNPRSSARSVTTARRRQRAVLSRPAGHQLEGPRFRSRHPRGRRRFDDRLAQPRCRAFQRRARINLHVSGAVGTNNPPRRSFVEGPGGAFSSGSQIGHEVFADSLGLTKMTSIPEPLTPGPSCHCSHRRPNDMSAPASRRP